MKLDHGSLRKLRTFDKRARTTGRGHSIDSFTSILNNQDNFDTELNLKDKSILKNYQLKFKYEGNN